MGIVSDTLIIYSTKELQFIPSKYSKLFYIYILSPIVICNGLYNTGIVSKRYWRFLRSLCYPHSNDNLIHNGNCSIYHNKKCSNQLLKNDYLYIVNKITYMYFKYYFLNSILCFFIFKKQLILKHQITNWFKSSLFLFLQNALQRFLMCKLPTKQYFHLYLITMLSSIPIIFENNSRVNQINNMMLSNIIISLIKKYYKEYKSTFSSLLFLLTFSKNKSIKIQSLIFSFINAIQELPTQRLLNNEEHVIIQWHPFL